MSVITHIKEMISANAVENAETWAAQWFAAPQRGVASEVAQAIVTVAGGGLDRLNHKTRLIEDLALNELQRVQLVLALEQQFALEISEQDAESIQTVGQLVACVQEKIGQRKPSDETKNK
jgi:acyl carrier protein